MQDKIQDTQNKIKVIGYTRVSTDKQVNEGEGLEIQEDRIKQFCIKNNYELINIFSDEGISGANEIYNRPGIIEMLKSCKNPPIQFVIVDKVDRLSRDLYQQLYIEKELLVNNVKVLYAAQESLNGDDIMLEAMRKMMGVFAEMERSMIKARLNDGIKKKFENGNKPTGRQPFGYKYAPDNKKTTIINEHQAEIVKEIFQLRVNGLSLNQIADTLNKKMNNAKYQQAYNHKPKTWTNQSVRLILTNDYYMGKITYDDEKMDGNHTPIIDVDVWERAQQVGKRA